MNAKRVRDIISIGWLATFLSIAVCYAIAYLGEPFRPTVTTLLSSAGIIFGLISPYLTLIVDANTSEKPYAIKDIESSAAVTLTVMCFIYWLFLVVVTYYGIVYRGFSVEADGKGITEATSFIAGASAIFSFMAVRPTVRLFAKS